MQAQNAKRIVFKVGTSSLTHENGKPDYKKMEALVRMLADLKNDGRDVVLVSSGAVAAGADSMRLPSRPSELARRQAVAAVGQCELMFIYDKLFSEYNKVVAQVLLTRDSVDRPERRQNLINTFTEIFNYGLIPIVNENDTIATDEMVYGENDTLSAVVAECVGADLLVIITDLDGLYDKNPNEYEDAKLIPIVETITQQMFDNAGGSRNEFGSGGMYTKLEAAALAQRHGISTAIISGKHMKNVYDLLAGRQVGTMIIGKKENEL